MSSHGLKGSPLYLSAEEMRKHSLDRAISHNRANAGYLGGKVKKVYR